MKKRIVCLGLGGIYQAFLGLYDDLRVEIVVLSDNDSAKWIQPGVMEPSPKKKAEFDFIVINLVYPIKIKEQLYGYRIEESRILYFYDSYKKLMIKSDYAILDLLKDNVTISYKCEKDIGELIDIQEKTLFLNARIYADAVKDKRLRLLEETEFQAYS